jgi:hypothetical protein
VRLEQLVRPGDRVLEQVPSARPTPRRAALEDAGRHTSVRANARGVLRRLR